MIDRPGQVAEEGLEGRWVIRVERSRARRADLPGRLFQPFPTFSEIYVAGLKALRAEIAAAAKPVAAGPPMGS